MATSPCLGHCVQVAVLRSVCFHGSVCLGRCVLVACILVSQITASSMEPCFFLSEICTTKSSISLPPKLKPELPTYKNPSSSIILDPNKTNNTQNTQIGTSSSMMAVGLDWGDQVALPLPLPLPFCDGLHNFLSLPVQPITNGPDVLHMCNLTKTKDFQHYCPVAHMQLVKILSCWILCNLSAK